MIQAECTIRLDAASGHANSDLPRGAPAEGPMPQDAWCGKRPGWAGAKVRCINWGFPAAGSPATLVDL